MTHRSYSATTGPATISSPHCAPRDVYIDMQYANRDCKDPIAYTKEPWIHCQNETNTYLSMRYAARETFKSKLDDQKKSRIKHEEDRIKQTRINFSSYDNKKNLMRNLQIARREWKAEVKAKQEAYVKSVQERPGKCPKGWKRDKQLDLDLLARVKSWVVEDYSESSAKDVDIEPGYGFKACVMYFEKESDEWVGHTLAHSKCIGKFPNQKIPVHKLLEEDDDNPLSAKCEPGNLRYFHLPSNNMRWVEKAIARYYGEKVGDHYELKAPDQMTKAEKLLCREFWRGQLHGGGGGKGPVHARHMRSRCSLIPRDVESGTYTRTHSAPTIPTISTPSLPDSKLRVKDFAIFLPYLHWETDSRRAKMADIVNEETTAREEAPKASKKGIIEIWQEKVKKNKKAKQIKLLEKPMKSKLGEYLFHIAKVADAIDYEADERLLRENLHLDPPLHIRRTLDQSYFLTLEDTGVRDQDQVVYRETRAGRSFHTRNTRIVMVDQLWLWILDENTIITSFPRRWGRNKPDPSGVHKSLRDRLARMPKGQIHSIYDIALIIIDQCSRVFFDRTKPLDQRPEVMDLFSSAIGNVTELKTIAFESFWRNMALRSLKPHEYVFNNANQKYLDINPEGALLRESQDIAEELRIMLRIYNQQLVVVKDFRKALLHMNGESREEPDAVRNLVKLFEARQNQDPKTTDIQKIYRKENVPEGTIQEANDLIELIRNRQSEIQDLEDAALRTCQQLQDLLTLKQQQASIIEAKAALKRADETVKQGRAIMLFTIVTIFFLPLGFFAAFFGMNNQEINGDSSLMHMGEQLKWMFSLSAVVIIVAVSMAFSPWTRATVTVLIKVPLAFIVEYAGLRSIWRLYIIDHATLDRKGQKGLEYIYKRQERKEAAKRKEEEKNKSSVVAASEEAEPSVASNGDRSRIRKWLSNGNADHIV